MLAPVGEIALRCRDDDKENDLNLGGEQSGHVVFLEHKHHRRRHDRSASNPF